MDQPGSVPAALILAMVAQMQGMPVPVGGAGRLAEALAGAVTDAGGRIRTGAEVTRIVVEKGHAVGVETRDGGMASARRAVLADTGPGTLFTRLVDPTVLPRRFLDGLRQFRYGTGVFKVDLALDGPVPWLAPGLADCGVVHLTGDLDNMAEAAFDARRGRLPAPAPADRGPAEHRRRRAGLPPGATPCGSRPTFRRSPGRRARGGATPGTGSSQAVLDRLEAHAPGLQSRIVGMAVRTPPDLEAENPNLVGGDLGVGLAAPWTNSWSSARCRVGSATPPRSGVCTCARPRPTPAAGCTAWWGATAPAGSWPTPGGADDGGPILGSGAKV